MTTLTSALSFVTDPDRLSEALGAGAMATRVRIKPGVSISASFAEPNGTPAGWVRLLWPVATGKAHKVATKAASLGLHTEERIFDSDLLLQWGNISSDPYLMAHIDRARAVGLVDPDDWQVLRHNPLRRLVARNDAGIVRIHATADRHVRGLDEFLRCVLPVPERLDDGSDPHVSVLADAGGFDLSSPEATSEQARGWHEEAGMLFARLHAARPASDLAQRLSTPAPSTRHVLTVHASIIGQLDAGLGQRIDAVAARAPEPLEAPLVPIHADASPDQVLVADDGSVLLTDFDRARMGFAALDVASYMNSADPAVLAPFLAGYQRAGATLPGDRELIAARIHARALTLADPLRRARTDWAERIARTLTHIEEDTECL